MSCLRKYLHSFFFSVNGPQALYVNPDCIQCISGINLSPANKKIFTVQFIFNTSKSKDYPLKEFYLKVP